MPNRGDRVKYSDLVSSSDPYRGAIGTVTHFCGDPGYDEYDEEATDVWVEWDNPAIPPCWVETSDLQVL